MQGEVKLGKGLSYTVGRFLKPKLVVIADSMTQTVSTHPEVPMRCKWGSTANRNRSKTRSRSTLSKKESQTATSKIQILLYNRFIINTNKLLALTIKKITMEDKNRCGKSISQAGDDSLLDRGLDSIHSRKSSRALEIYLNY